MDTPLVSVILSSYNQPELLERAFNSLISQKYREIEIIIVDDCSTDVANKVLIERFKSLYPQKVTTFYQEKNVGIPANKNTGFRLAKGEYITYLDGDDTYYKNKIATEIDVFNRHPEVDVVYSNFDIKNSNGEVLSIWSSDKRPEGYIFKDIILNNFPDCHTHRYELFKRYVLSDLNYYDEQFSVYHDLDFMLRYSIKYKVAFNNYIGSSYYKNPESIVSRTKQLELIEQQETVYTKYTEAIKKQGLEKKFKKYLDNLKLDKQFYANKINYAFLFKALVRQPYQVIKVVKIINYLYKTQKIYE